MASGSTKRSRAKTTTTKPKSKRTSQSRTTRGRNKSRNTASELRDEVGVLITFAFAIILLLSNFGMAGSIGEAVNHFMFGVFGLVEYIVPLIIAGSVIFMIANKQIGVAKVKSVALYALIVWVCGIIQLIVNKPDLDSGLGAFYTYAAESKNGGGLIGGLVCKAMSPLGTGGSYVILIILIIICIVIITEKSFIGGVRRGSERVYQSAREDYANYREHSEQRKELNAKRKEELDAEREKKRKARMDKKVQGVVVNSVIPKKKRSVNADLHEIRPEQEVETKKQKRDNSFLSLDEQVPNDELKKEPQETGEKIDFLSDLDKQAVDAFESEVNYVDEQTSQAEQEQFYSQEHEGQNAGEDENKMLSYEEEISVLDDEDGVVKMHVPVSKDMEEAFIPDTADDKASESQNEDMHAIGSDMARQEQAVSELHDETAGKKEKKRKYLFPPISLLNGNKSRGNKSQQAHNRETAMRLQQTLQNFGVKVTITDISCGPAVTRYELQPEQGVKVSKIVSLTDDIKLNLAAADIRMEAPIPGKAAIGIEVPNKETTPVTLRELIEADEFKNSSSAIAFAAGRDIAGKVIVADIAKMPHLLIAGATGSGKSVCINTIIMSILYRADPADVKLIMVDPKVVELSVYNGIPHLMIPVVTDPKKASGALNWAVAEMTDRYQKFAEQNVRDLKGYNEKVTTMHVDSEEERPAKMPQIVIIIDELADLMMVAPGEVEDAICRLAQLARAAGIHLVIATQRPSVNVITGLIKANVPSRIAFSVSSGVDSRTIIDMNGAEKLLGKGDMLFYPSGYQKPVRVQGAFVSDKEVGSVVSFLKEHLGDSTYDEEITSKIEKSAFSESQAFGGDRDAYFAEAGKFIIEKQKGSIGMLQRYYKIGFNRAARIMDQLADVGVVGPEEGTKPRKVLMTAEEFEEFLQSDQ